MATISPSTAEIVRQSGAVPGADYLLEVEGVRKAFPGVLALDDVSFRLKRGHVHALMGENGAGKSTLMKIIAGIYTPDAGSFKLKGQEIKLTSPLDALQYGIAMIHQELNLMNFMTVAENIWIRREPLNASRLRAATTRCAAAPRRCSIGSTSRSTPRRRCATSRVANRQMVEIAKAVSYDSDVLIMDEPTSAMTEREVEHLFRIIRTLKAQGKGIIYITHKMNELFEIADEVSVFRDGKFVGEHAAADVTRDDIIKLMVGREITQMFPKETVPIGDVALSVRDLCLEGKFHDISFDLRKGEILGFAGLVGSGRSNVAETLFGVTPATSGAILVDGKEIAIKNPGRRWTPAWPSSPRTARRAAASCCSTSCPTCRSRSCATAIRRWASSRSGRSRRSARSRRRRLQGAHARSRGADHQSLRRQPAEGADRPLADDQAAASSSSTSRRAASTSAPRPRSTGSSANSPVRASRC